MDNKENLKIQGIENIPKTMENEEKKNLKKSVKEVAGKKKTEKPKAVIYVGPSVPNNILTMGRVYKNLPEYAADFISKNPVIGKLIIDVEKLPKFKRNVEIKGTEEYRMYYECDRIIKEGGLL